MRTANSLAARISRQRSQFFALATVCLAGIASLPILFLAGPATGTRTQPILPRNSQKIQLGPLNELGVDQYRVGDPTFPAPSGAWEKIQDEVVIIIKTGLEVADTRMPHISRYGMLNTPGRVIPNLVKVATDPNEELGIHGIRDMAHSMLVNASEETKAKLFSQEGWRGDIYKNFPALKLAHTLHPNKTMYIHADDDTFFILDALADHIDRFRKYKEEGRKVIEGRIFTANGCKLPDDHFQSKSFAHGGSGIFLSEPAMRILHDNIEECFERYIGCWAGDASIAFCAKHNSIEVRSFPVKLGFAGMVKHFFPMAKGLETRPSEHPVTFHKIAPIEQAALSDLVNLRLELGLPPATYVEIREHLEQLRLTEPIRPKPVGNIKGDPRNPTSR